MLKFSTANGGTIEASRSGILWDIHVRDADGRTIASVTMTESDKRGLVSDLRAAH